VAHVTKRDLDFKTFSGRFIQQNSLPEAAKLGRLSTDTFFTPHVNELHSFSSSGGEFCFENRAQAATAQHRK
jgi:hypothetical protein